MGAMNVYFCTSRCTAIVSKHSEHTNYSLRDSYNNALEDGPQ